MVLGTLYVGGYLMSQKDVNAGNLMSFLIASQTIQRYYTCYIKETWNIVLGSNIGVEMTTNFVDSKCSM